jgi:hypothetical protein
MKILLNKDKVRGYREVKICVEERQAGGSICIYPFLKISRREEESNDRTI